MSRQDTIVFAAARGLANIDTRAPATPRTLFRVASVTKTFIGPLFLALRRAGKLSLDEPAARWIPEFPRSAGFTPRMLLNHTAGLGEYTDRPFDVLVRDAQRDYSNEALLAYMASIEPLFVHEPGTAWAYSNTGYILLGIVAERAGALPLAALLRQHVFLPARLNETDWDAHPAATPERATGYGFRDDAWVPAPVVSTSYIGASGAIRSTARDLCHWYNALFAGAVLKPDELQEMLAPAQLRDGAPARVRGGAAYGLGIFTGTAGERRVAWHSGSTAGFAADARHYPDSGISIAMLGNADASRMGSEPSHIRETVLDVLEPRDAR